MIRDNIADQLVYSTVKLTCYNSKEKSDATAFFMIHEYDDKNIVALVTNKHAVTSDEEYKCFFDKAEIVLTKSDKNGTPLDKEHITIHIDKLEKRCIFHPDASVDLCFVFINDLISDVGRSGNIPYYRCIGTDFSITEEVIQTLTPIEDIVMVGYPIGLIDEKNNKPVIRKGITATDIRLDYNGEREFVIDAACFHGSSGSPIFLRKMRLEKEKTENGVSIGMQPAYAFLGILYAGPVETVEGEIKIEVIPTSKNIYSESQHTINLGYVIKANVITELFNIVKESQENSVV